MALSDFLTPSGVILMLLGIGAFAFAVFIFGIFLSFLLD